MYCSKKYKLQSKRRSSSLVSASFRSGSTEMWCWFSTVLLPLSFSAEAAQWFLSWAVNHHRYWAVLQTVTPGRDCILNPETGNSLLLRPIKCFTNAEDDSTGMELSNRSSLNQYSCQRRVQQTAPSDKVLLKCSAVPLFPSAPNWHTQTRGGVRDLAYQD